MLHRRLKCVTGTLQSFGGVLLRRFERCDGVSNVLLCGLVLSGNRALYKLRDRFCLRRKGLDIGLDGPAAFCRGIADCRMQLLHTRSNMVERVLDLSIHLDFVVYFLRHRILQFR